MSLPAFQTALARMVTDPAFHRRIRSRRFGPLRRRLTAKERGRLEALASDRGVDVTATLVESFRLGKIVSLLPLTRQALGTGRLLREARAFWAAHPPTTFYFFEEALDFCAFLENRVRAGLRVPYLREVVRYERARLEQRRAIAERRAVADQHLRFRHDPVVLFRSLLAGERPHAVARLRRPLDVLLAADGTLRLASAATSRRGSAASATRRRPDGAASRRRRRSR